VLWSLSGDPHDKHAATYDFSVSQSLALSNPSALEDPLSFTDSRTIATTYNGAIAAAFGAPHCRAFAYHRSHVEAFLFSLLGAVPHTKDGVAYTRSYHHTDAAAFGNANGRALSSPKDACAFSKPNAAPYSQSHPSSLHPPHL